MLLGLRLGRVEALLERLVRPVLGDRLADVGRGVDLLVVELVELFVSAVEAHDVFASSSSITS